MEVIGENANEIRQGVGIDNDFFVHAFKSTRHRMKNKQWAYIRLKSFRRSKGNNQKSEEITYTTKKKAFQFFPWQKTECL